MHEKVYSTSFVNNCKLAILSGNEIVGWTLDNQSLLSVRSDFIGLWMALGNHCSINDGLIGGMKFSNNIFTKG